MANLRRPVRALILAGVPTVLVYFLFLQERALIPDILNGTGSWLIATKRQTDNTEKKVSSAILNQYTANITNKMIQRQTDNITEKTFTRAILNQYTANITAKTVHCNNTESYSRVTSSKPLNSTKQVVVKHSNEHILLSPPLNQYEASINLDINIDRNYTFGRRNRYSKRPKEDRIPRIIHFMWKTEIIPSVLVDNLKTFVKHNPKWTYYFWTDASCYKFIADKYPHLLEIYKTYGSNVSRADAARYAVVHYYGGAYFDLDTKCIKPLDPLLETEECLVTPEPMEHAYIVLNRRSVLGNCVFLCKPRHGFFRHALSELKKTNQEEELMTAAGPVFFTDAFSSYIVGCITNRSLCNDNIHLMGCEYFLDHVKFNVHRTLVEKCGETSDSDDLMDTCNVWKKRNSENRILSSKAYTVHLYFSTYDHVDQLDIKHENNIKNILPNVRIYPAIYDTGV